MTTTTIIKVNLSLFIQLCLLLCAYNILPAQSKVDTLISIANQQSKQLNKDDYKVSYAITLDQIGDSWFSSGKFDNAASIFRKAADLSLQTGQVKQSADIQYKIADCYSRMNRTDSAILSFKLAAKQYQSVHDTGSMAKAMAATGYCYFQLSDSVTAFRLVEEATRMAEQNTNERIKASCYHYMALLYSQEGNDLRKAKSYIHREAAILQLLGDSANFYKTIVELANLQLRSEAYDSAIVLFRKTLQHYTLLDIQSGMGLALHSLAATYAAQNLFDSAVIYSNKAIEKFSSVNDSTSLAVEYCRLGTSLAASGNNEDAVNAMRTGWHIAALCNDPANQRELALGLSTVLEQSKNYEEALQYYKRYTLLTDSIKSMEGEKKLTAMKSLHAIREMERSASSISNASSWEVKAAADQRTIRILMIGIALLVLLAFFLLYTRFSTRRRAAQQFRQKDKMIEEERSNSYIQRLRAEQAEKFTSQFMAKMSEEILAPIHAISGFTHLLEDEKQQEKRSEYLNAIRRSTDRLLALNQDVFDLRMLEAGSLKLKKTPLRINDVLNFIDKTIAPSAVQKKLHWQHLVANDVPPLLMGDAALLQQLLLKLVGNAIKFTESGTVSMEVSKVHPANTILFKVADTGAGIAGDRLQQILKIFSQPGAHTQHAGSDGIGLTICSKLAALMNGRLDVDSKEGLGSTFYFSMPYEVASTVQWESLQRDELMTAVQTGASLAGSKVLIGDANEDDLLLLSEMLKKFIPDLAIDCCKSGNEVLAALETQAERININEALHGLDQVTLQAATGYSLLLLNVQMPAMDAYATVGYIRHPLRNQIPIIALSTFTNAATTDRLLKAGIQRCLLKPFTAEELIMAIAGELKINAASLHENNQEEASQKHASTVAVAPKEKYQWIQLEHLEKLVAQEPVQVQRYLRLFNELIPARILTLQSALEQRDFPLIRKTVHVMKPQLASLGMSNAKKLAESIESNYHREERIHPAAEILLTECLAALEEVRLELGISAKS